MTKLQLIKDYKEEDDLVEGIARSACEGADQVEILEAGCGQRWSLRLDGIPFRVTGVDLDPDALKYRVEVSKDLAEAIVADLREVDLGDRTFDIVYNAFVLEHIAGAEDVLARFSRWLKPGGLIILRIPDRDSVFGFLTNLTPFWFHVFYHRRILGRPNAGKPGFGPYPTHYDPVVSRKGIHDWCRANGFVVRAERGHAPYVIERGGRNRVITAITRVVSALSFGRLPWRHCNLTFVLQKEPAAAR